MEKVISSITKEQEAKIPEYIKKWVDLASTPIDRKEIKKIFKRIYGKKKLIIIGESFQNTIDLIRVAIEGKELKYDPQFDSQLRSQLHSQLHSQLYSQLDSQLRSQLDSKLYSQLHSQLRSQLHSKLYSQLHSQLRSQLHSQLRSQLHSQFDSQLRSQLHSQLHSQLYSQLDSQLRSQLDSQLYSQLHSQLRSQLHSKLYSQLHSQLRSQLDSQLRSQLHSQLDSQLRSQLRSQLDSQLYSQLYSQLHSQLRSQLRSQLKDLKWSYYISYYLYDWAGYYDYADSIGVEFDKDSLKQYFDILLNIPIVIFIGDILFVCEKPKVSWSNNGLLHSNNLPAIRWTDGTGFYFLNGVQFPEDLFKKVTSGHMPFKDILAIVDTDQRTQAMRFGNVREFIQHAKGKKLDEFSKMRLDGSIIKYELYKFPKGDIFTKDAYYMIYDDLVPGSDKQYMSGVPEFKTVPEAMSWKFSSDDYTLTPKEWVTLMPGIDMN